jgi:hypothetical protein
MSTMRSLTFERRYVPLEAPSGEPVWTHGETLTHPLTHVWTLVDGERGGSYALAGYHVVNAFGYVVTTRPWQTGCEEARW